MSYHQTFPLLSHFSRRLWESVCIPSLFPIQLLPHLSCTTYLEKCVGVLFLFFFLISKCSAEKEIKLFQFGLVGSHLMWTQAS